MSIRIVSSAQQASSWMLFTIQQLSRSFLSEVTCSELFLKIHVINEQVLIPQFADIIWARGWAREGTSPDKPSWRVLSDSRRRLLPLVSKHKQWSLTPRRLGQSAHTITKKSPNSTAHAAYMHPEHRARHDISWIIWGCSQSAGRLWTTSDCVYYKSIIYLLTWPLGSIECQQARGRLCGSN